MGIYDLGTTDDTLWINYFALGCLVGAALMCVVMVCVYWCMRQYHPQQTPDYVPMNDMSGALSQSSGHWLLEGGRRPDSMDIEMGIDD